MSHDCAVKTVCLELQSGCERHGCRAAEKETRSTPSARGTTAFSTHRQNGDCSLIKKVVFLNQWPSSYWLVYRHARLSIAAGPVNSRTYAPPVANLFPRRPVAVGLPLGQPPSLMQNALCRRDDSGCRLGAAQNLRWSLLAVAPGLGAGDPLAAA